MAQSSDITPEMEYILAQKKSWLDLGYNSYMSRHSSPPQASNLSYEVLNSLIDTGSLQGNKISEISGDKVVTGTLDATSIKTSTLDASVDVGNPSSGFVRLDGPNNRIVINDGTTNRIVIGNV